MNDTLDILTFRAGYTTTLVMLGAMVLGAATGLVGTLSVLRRRALIADTIAHSTLPGLAGAFIIATALGVSGQSLPILLPGAAVSGTLGALATHGLTRIARLNEDAAMAVVLSVFFGVGVVLLTIVQSLRTGGQAGLPRFIFGQAAAMSRGDVVLSLALAALVALIAGALYKEFRLICFDPTYAAAIGRRVQLLDVLLLALITTVTVIGLQSVGLIMIVALQVIPAAAARFWTERLWVMMLAAAAMGALASYIGVAVSASIPRAPTGACIVLAGAALFVVSALLGRARGLIPVYIRTRRLHAPLEADA